MAIRLDTGYVKADTDNLPRLDAVSLNNFYRNNLDFLSAESKNVKTARSTRESYTDSAIGYVQVKREDVICTVKAKVTPEHNVKSKKYSVTVVINEAEGEVLSCKCEDCAASAGGCKHAVAFLYWLHRRSEEPSVTSTECYWKRAKLSTAGDPNRFVTLAEVCKTEIKPLGPKDPTFLQELRQATKDEGEGVIFSLFKPSPLDCFHVYKQFLQYKRLDETPTVDKFLSFFKSSFGDVGIVQKRTIAQSESEEWFDLRFGRITGSKLYETARCKTSDGALVESIMGATRPIMTPAIERGKELEARVIQAVAKARNIKIKRCGLFLNCDYPIFGVSPDGLTDIFCIEVKCPFKEKTKENYVKNDVIAKKYFYQLQLQMFFTGKKKGLFCVASPQFENNNEVEIVEVGSNETDLLEIMELAQSFWCNNIYTKLS